MDAERHFLVYGSLQPGGPNHFRLAELQGSWRTGFLVNGDLTSEGWGHALGYPGLVWSRHGPSNPLQVLVSDRLPEAWPTLDAFEGDGYIRSLAPVFNGQEVLIGNIYLLASKK